jgi:hypothetical protein
MSNDLHYSDEEIRHLLLQIKADQKPAPTPDEAPVQTKPVEVTARVSGITRELSIDEILKKIESELSNNKPARVNDR